MIDLRAFCFAMITETMNIQYMLCRNWIWNWIYSHVQIRDSCELRVLSAHFRHALNIHWDYILENSVFVVIRNEILKFDVSARSTRTECTLIMHVIKLTEWVDRVCDSRIVERFEHAERMQNSNWAWFWKKEQRKQSVSSACNEWIVKMNLMNRICKCDEELKQKAICYVLILTR